MFKASNRFSWKCVYVPVHDELKRLLSESNIEALNAYCVDTTKQKSASKRIKEIEDQFAKLCEEVGKYKRIVFDPAVARSRFMKGIEAIGEAWTLLTDAAKAKRKVKSRERKSDDANSEMLKDLAHPENLLLLYCWAIVEELTSLQSPELISGRNADPFKEFDLEKTFSRILVDRGRSRGGDARREISLVHALARHSHLLADADSHNRFLKDGTAL